MISLAGVAFEINDTAAPLSPPEKEWLQAVAKRTRLSPRSEPFILDVRFPGVVEKRRMFDHDPTVPAALEGTDVCVSISDTHFVAELDLTTRRGVLYRDFVHVAPMQVTLRSALCVLLPLENAVPIHSAAIALDRKGVVFYGQSEAGKSTIASLSPYPVLSDELNAIYVDSTARVCSTGMVGTLDRADAPDDEFPVMAMIQLKKGAEFRLRRLNPLEAFRSFIGVTIVPPATSSWNRAIAVLRRLSDDVPVYCMEWNKEAPPWTELAELVR